MAREDETAGGGVSVHTCACAGVCVCVDVGAFVGASREGGGRGGDRGSVRPAPQILMDMRDQERLRLLEESRSCRLLRADAAVS
jgi:hypothetical protein